MADVNRLLHDHGFGVALILGIIMLVIGLSGGRPDVLAVATIFLLVGVVARPLEEFGWSRSSIALKWQQETLQEVRRLLEERRHLVDRLPEISESVEAVKVGAATRAHGQTATVITRAESPSEFAETLIEQIIQSALGEGVERKPPG
jgi:hypothetical protein